MNGDTTITESKIEKKCCKLARDKDWIAWKLWAFNQRGIPDRILISPTGHVIFVEFKRPQGKLSAWQTKIGCMLQARGLSWMVIDSVDQFKQLL